MAGTVGRERNKMTHLLKVGALGKGKAEQMKMR